MTRKRIWSDFLVLVVAVAILLAIFVGAHYGHADVCGSTEKIRVTETGQERITLQYCKKDDTAGGGWACDPERTYQRSELRSRKRSETFKAVLGGLGGFFRGLIGGGRSGGLAGLVAAGPLGGVAGLVGGGGAGALTGALSGYTLSEHKAGADAIELVLKSEPGVCTDAGKLKTSDLVPALLAALDGMPSRSVEEDTRLARNLVEETGSRTKALRALIGSSTRSL